ncbi:MAG: DUF4157 domain-containing protein [Candidatus Thiodiazotropha sp.]
MAGNLAMQQLLHAGVIQARLNTGNRGDSAERHADNMARQALQPDALRQGSVKAATEGMKGSEGSTAAVGRELSKRVALPGLGSGSPLGLLQRVRFEAGFGADFSDVRLHTRGAGAVAASALGAQAFTYRNHIAFAPGRYDPAGRQGRELLAHELAHVVQQRRGVSAGLQRRDEPDVASESGAGLESVIVQLSSAVREGEVATAVELLRGRSESALRTLRQGVNAQTSVWLERWFQQRIGVANSRSALGDALSVASLLIPGAGSPVRTTRLLMRVGGGGDGAAAEEGLRLLWRILPLLDRLEIYTEVGRELEQAQLDVIRAASRAERDVALTQESRLNAIYAGMNPQEEYEARLLMKPADRYEAVVQLIARAEGLFVDDEDEVFNALFDLSPEERGRVWRSQRSQLEEFLSDDQMTLVESLMTGSEAQAVMARLRLATEGRIDDTEAIAGIVARVAQLMREKRRLLAALESPDINDEQRDLAQTRLQQLGDLEALAQFPASGELDEESFLGRLHEAASDSDQFGQWALGIGADPLSVARQQVLMANGTFSVDNEAIERVMMGLRAPSVEFRPGENERDRERRQSEANSALRRDLLSDPQVRGVLERLDHQGPAGSMHVGGIERLAEADPFREVMFQFGDAVHRPDYGEMFRLALVISRREDWRERFHALSREPWNTFAWVHGEPREIVLEIINTRRMPTESLLAYTGDIRVLRVALGQLDEQRRGQLRLGYLLNRERRDPSTLNPDELSALRAFNEFERQVRSSQALGVFDLDTEQAMGLVDREGVEDVLDAALGSEPTADEFETAEGRYRAAALLFQRMQARIDLERGLVSGFTETDETMVAAAREFAALWEQTRSRGTLTAVELAAMIALYDRFEHRSEEFTEASNTISEIAGIVAATAAGIIVVAATGGTATPGVIAAAAAAGAGARVVTREMFGADYYEAISSEGARDALLGAIDGALVVVGSSLAAKGTQMLGLGGRGLLSGAAEAGTTAVEQGAQSLGRRVATGAVREALDGLFSGVVSEGIAALTDERTWRRGVWQGLVRAGQAALVGGLTGMATGGVLGGAMPVLGRAGRRLVGGLFGESLDQVAERLGASETLDAARRASHAGDYEETRRLFHQLEDQLEPHQAERLWRELAEGFEGHAMAEVTTGITEHHLSVCDAARGICLCSNPPCQPLRRILTQFERHITAGGETTPQVTEALGRARSALSEAEAALPPGGGLPPPNKVEAAVASLEHLARVADVEDVALRGLGEAVSKARFQDVFPMEGLTIDQVRADPHLRRIFDEGYTTQPRLQRKSGRMASFPRLLLDEGGTLRVVGDIVRPPRLQLEAQQLATKAALETHLADNSQAFRRYRDALLRERVPGRNGQTARELIDEQLEILRRQATESLAADRPVYLDNLRHSFHENTRDAVLDWIFAGGEMAQAHRRFLSFTRDLNPAYLGSFGERFYLRLRGAQGEAMLQHPRLLDSPGDVDRVPDFAHRPPPSEDLVVTRPGELGDVKATAHGLEGRDIEQIGDMLESFRRNNGVARALIGDQIQNFEHFRLVFLNPDGALGSLNQLQSWFQRYGYFSIEVFDLNGVSHHITRAQWRGAGRSRAGLEALLRGLTGSGP